VGRKYNTGGGGGKGGQRESSERTEAFRPVKQEALVFSSFRKASISSSVVGRA